MSLMLHALVYAMWLVGRALSVLGALFKALVAVSDLAPRFLVRRISAVATGRR